MQRFLAVRSSDKALAIAVGANLPATAYVTGSTQSSNFPTDGSITALQTSLKGTTNAFLSVISQNPTTGMTSLAYSSYLGGSETDTGQSVWFGAVNEIYVTGTTTSWDFPWQDNFQPFNGDSDAFVTKLDPTSAGRSFTTVFHAARRDGANRRDGWNERKRDRGGYIRQRVRRRSYNHSGFSARWKSNERNPNYVRQLPAIAAGE